MSLPGDTAVPSPSIASTHAITIDATVDSVWPWIVQIGQNRGGFYSYTVLENLLGCQMKNAERIHPDWQNLDQGDIVQIHPKFPPLLVKEIETNHCLVLWQQTSFNWTWTFALKRCESNQSRLLVRTRIFSDRWTVSLLLYPIMTVGHYVMERKMLLGIKRRSECN